MEPHIHENPFTSTISKYQCPPQGYARVPNGSIGGRLSYKTEPNPLRYKQKEQRQHGTCCYEYNNNKGFISYTQSWPQYHDGSFTYYLYDHLARPIETGEARITQIKTGDVTEAKQLTNAAVTEHILGLDNRTNVMVAVYDDENAFPIAKDADCWYTHLDDKIATVYYYPQINACDTRTANGVYHTSQPWYASRYHYDADRKITATHYQCTLYKEAVAATNPVQEAVNIQPAHTTADPVGIHQHLYNAIPLHIPIFAASAAYYSGQPSFIAPGTLSVSSCANTNPHHPQHTLVYNPSASPIHQLPIHGLHCRGITANACLLTAYSHSPPGKYLA